MIVKIKYVLIYLNIIFIHFGTNSGFVISKYKDKVPSGNVRVKRQDGYVYDKPSVSFDLPTATSIAPTQAPTVDRTQMQMYYAYPAPASGDTVNVGQNTGSAAGSTGVVASGADGYNYGVQNTQVTDTRTVSQSQNTANTGYQSTAVAGTQAVVSSGSGYGDGRPAGTAVSNTVPSTGIISTSAPRYLPPQTSGQNTVVTSNEAQTSVVVTNPTDSYVPPSVQVSSPQIEQTVITQSATDAALPPANVNTGYLAPSPQPAPNVSNQPVPGPVQTVPNVPTQQYLPPVESSGGQNPIQGPITAPAATYLPPVF